MSAYAERAPWGGTTEPELPAAPGLSGPRRYAELLYNLPDLIALRALDGNPLAVQEPGDAAPVPRPLLRRLLGALSLPLSAASAALDAAPGTYDPARPEAARDAAFYLRLAGYPLPPGLPAAWALALLRAAPELLPVGRSETYLRTAELIYGRGTRSVTYDGDTRIRSASTARGVYAAVLDEERAVTDDTANRAVRLILTGPGGTPPDPAFVRLWAALAPAAFTAVPARHPGLPLLVIGAPPGAPHA